MGRPVHAVLKKSGFTVVKNENKELVQTRLPTKIRVCIDYKKLNAATRKDHFPLPFIDQMLERLAATSITVSWMVTRSIIRFSLLRRTKKKTMFTCLFETFAYRRMPFSLCNAPAMFQLCMLSLFLDLVE